MNCPKCGAPVIGAQKFCSKCGTPSGTVGAGSQSGASAPKQNSAPTFRPPGWEETADIGPIVAKPSPKKTTAKKSSLSEKVEKNWTPPPGSAAKSPPPTPPRVLPVTIVTKPSGAPSKMRSAINNISVSARNMTGKFSMKLPEFNKTRSSRKILLLCAALVAIVMTLAIAKLSCMRHSSKFNASSLPPGVQVISEKIDQSGPYPKIETIVIADNYVQADEIEELLKNIYEYQKDRTDFAGNKKTGAIAVYTYASQAIYSSDPDWWIGRLLWDKENPDPQINTNLDALLPRQEETGSGGLSRNDYLAQSDDIAVKLIAIMKQLQKDFRDFEKLTMNQDDFRAKAEKASDDIYELTKTLPDPPIKDCADLDKAFLGLVQETQYFEEIFAPGSNVFVENRLNTEEFYDKLNSFAAAEGIYNAEREKLKNK